MKYKIIGLIVLMVIVAIATCVGWAVGAYNVDIKCDDIIDQTQLSPSPHPNECQAWCAEQR